jgi:hypothetical protein
MWDLGFEAMKEDDLSVVREFCYFVEWCRMKGSLYCKN